MKKLLHVMFLFIFFNQVFATKPGLSGYVTEMPSVFWLNQPQSTLWWQNLVHNRLDFTWQIDKNFSFNAGLRNRFIAGSSALIDFKSMNFDKGIMDLTFNTIASTNGSVSSVLNHTFDRLNVVFEKNKWQFILGRQRINWGQTLVWNPNDIFNTYSFFDFDYPERPGCDAFRGTYFHTPTSSTELAVSVNHYNKVTAAAMHRWNVKNFDFQILGGMLETSDVLVGGAVTTDIKGLNIRGEFSIFHPFKNFADTITTAAVSVGFDYMFSNSLMLQTEILYNNVSSSNINNGLISLYSAPLSAKNLSVCNWNWFAQVSYPITPLLNGSLSAMYFIDMKGFYTGFSLDYSLAENLDLSAIAQYFFMKEPLLPSNVNMLLGFIRLKYSF